MAVCKGCAKLDVCFGGKQWVCEKQRMLCMWFLGIRGRQLCAWAVVGVDDPSVIGVGAWWIGNRTRFVYLALGRARIERAEHTRGTK